MRAFSLTEVLAMRGVDQAALARQLGTVPTLDAVVSGKRVGITGPWTVVIDDWHPPTVNALLRGHWAKRARVKKNAVNRVVTACRDHGVPTATGKRRVVVTVSVPNMSRQPDPDNVLKCLLDGLTRCGALVDDQAGYVDWPRPSVVKGPKSTVIEISEIH